MKTAIIGLGRMGRRHLDNVLSLGLQLCGVCDPRKEALEAVVKEKGLDSKRCYQDARFLLKEARPECVIVASTSPAHCDLTCQAADAGARYILCEKPMAVSLEQCDRMLDVCRRHQCRLAINHPMRFMERFTEVKAMVDSGRFGPLGSVAIVGANMGLSMNGIHRFEAFHRLTGEGPDQVTAWFSEGVLPNPRGPEFKDRAGTIHLTTASGKRFHLEAGADLGHGFSSVYTCRYGQIVVEELEGVLSWNVRKPEFRDRPTTQYACPAERGVRQIQPADPSAPSRAVLEALLEDGPYPTGIESRLAVAVLVAAYESHERGHVPVRVDDQLPKARLFPWA